MALARSRRLGIADLLEFAEKKRKKGPAFSLSHRLRAMTDSHLWAFFLCFGHQSLAETFYPVRLKFIALVYNRHLSFNIKTF